MTKIRLGNTCPNCKNFPQPGATTDLPFVDNRIKVTCQHCGWKLDIIREFVPKCVIIGNPPNKVQQKTQTMYEYGYIISANGETERVVLGTVDHSGYKAKKLEIDSAAFVSKQQTDKNTTWFMEKSQP